MVIYIIYIGIIIINKPNTKYKYKENLKLQITNSIIFINILQNMLKY